MKLKELKKKNPRCTIHRVTDKEFALYGKVLDGYDFEEYIEIMEEKEIPEDGNIYMLEDAELMKAAVTSQLQERFYGGMAIQSGYCNGHTHQLNALEYHKCSEVDIAVTDMVLLLGNLWDVEDNSLDTAMLKGFYIPAKTAVELYATTLHYAPCALDDTGFKSIVILPKGTNESLEEKPEIVTREDALLWKRNKWVLAHPEGSAASKGYYPGLYGDNTEVLY